MSQYSFGSGVLYGVSLTNTPATPVRFGALQGVNVDFAFTTKQLFGQNQFPLAIGRGTGKITGKADFAQLNAQVYNDIFFGLSNPATGSTLTAVAEAQTVTANVVNVTNNGASFRADLGVVKASDQSVYTRVSAGPVGQQYTVNESTGAYTFNSSQNNTPVLVSYNYANGSTGKTITITNQLLGASPQFKMVLTETFNAIPFTLILNACVSSKLTLPTKLEDFTIASLDFEAFADSGGNIGTWSMGE